MNNTEIVFISVSPSCQYTDQCQGCLLLSFVDNSEQSSPISKLLISIYHLDIPFNYQK